MFLTWKRLTALSYQAHIQTNTLYLRHTAEAMGASHGIDMTSSLLGASVVSKHGYSLCFLPSTIHIKLSAIPTFS